MKFKENEVPPARKEEELLIFLVMTTKYCSSFSFDRGTLLSLWTSFELQLKKVNPWVGQKLKFSFHSMNWTWVDIQNSRQIHALWFIRVFSKYPVLGTLIFSTEFQYSKPLINPYSFSITNYFWMAMHIFKLLDLHSRVYLKHFPLILTLSKNSWMFLS